MDATDPNARSSVLGEWLRSHSALYDWTKDRTYLALALGGAVLVILMVLLLFW